MVCALCDVRWLRAAVHELRGAARCQAAMGHRRDRTESRRCSGDTPRSCTRGRLDAGSAGGRGAGAAGERDRGVAEADALSQQGDLLLCRLRRRQRPGGRLEGGGRRRPSRADWRRGLPAPGGRSRRRAIVARGVGKADDAVRTRRARGRGWAGWCTVAGDPAYGTRRRRRFRGAARLGHCRRSRQRRPNGARGARGGAH